MSTNHQYDGEDEIQAARRTAYALGQTEGSERAEVAAELAASPQARQEVEAIEALAAQLKEAAHEAPLPQPSPALREAIEKQLAELEPAVGSAVPRAARPWWRSRLAALAGVAACIAAIVVPVLWATHLIGPVRERTVAQQDLGDAPVFESTAPMRGKSQSEPDKLDNINIGQLEVNPPDLKMEPGASIVVPKPEKKPSDARTVPESPARDVEYNDHGQVVLHEAARGGYGGGGSGGAPGPGPGTGPGPGPDSGTSPDSPVSPPGDSGQNSSGDNSKSGNSSSSGNHKSSGDNVTVDDPGNAVAKTIGRNPDHRRGAAGDGDEESPGNSSHDGARSGRPREQQKEENIAPVSGDYGKMEAKIKSIGEEYRAAQASTTEEREVVVHDDVVHLQPAREGGDRRADGRSGGGQPDSKPSTPSPGPLYIAAGDGAAPGKVNKVDSTDGRLVESKQLQDHSNTPVPVLSAPTRRQASEFPKPAKKPLETWKPAHVVPNSSRLMVGEREELPLKGMQVDVRVDGFRARVLIDLYYFNDRPQQLEGNFQLRLPDEASPYFFAFGRTVYQAPQITPSDSMFFKPQQVSQGDTTPEKILALRGNSWEQPKVARMVPREKAALAYRDTVRRRIDPALVEWSGAGVFQCRVFPLAPQSLHRVTIGYDVDLLRVGEDLEMRLDMPSETPATIVDLNIAAGDARQVSLDAPATASPDGQRLSYRLVDPKDRPLAVRLRKPGTQMLVGADEATNSYFATRVGLTLPETPSAERAKQAIFLVDTSLSAGPQFPLWTKLLRATLENNRDSIKEFAVLFFNVETFWWQEKFVANTPENVEALLAYADGLALEGATDLGHALKEAAAPAWGRVGFSPSPDLFLLSDGAATWGEDRWPLLASALTPGPSPILLGTVGGRGEKDALTRSPSSAGSGVSALFAYRTGLAGGDPRLLAYLAEQTGGAVFSLVGEAEIAAASVAHRNRPWRLTGIETAGGHDLLVAGRPQYVFPGQQLLIVGRLEPVGNALRGVPQNSGDAQPSLVFTLQQGKANQTITVKMDRVLTSELAARTFGQVATSQLEDVSGVAAAAEPVATAYARHFRVTGRTCSLLMLESEQDYARCNIKPEEDSFVVKDRPADSIVAKAITETLSAMSDPKVNFLAWYRRVRASSEVHFDLPASLDVALEGLPAETFAPSLPPLQCKLRLRKDLPENVQQPWQTGLPDYETLAAEAERRLTAYGADDALRGLSSLVEDRPGDTALARDLAFSAIQWQRPGEAYHLLRRASTARAFEPITFHAMAHCLEQMGRADLAIIYYELTCGGQWDGRFGDIHNIAQLDYLRFLRRVADGRLKPRLADYAKARMATLSALRLRDTADVAALLFWNTDGTDVDLHVIEPSGEECFYQHTQTASGGQISRDVTTGYGPELYVLPTARPGNYQISAHYFATDANRASTRTKVLAFVYEGWGTSDERVSIKALALTGRSEKHELATVKR